MSLESLISPLYEMMLLSTPIIFATIGEIYAERSGILNLGIEGIMSLGAAIAFVVTYTTRNIALGILAALIAGGLLASIHAFISITFNANQVISGLALAMLGLGLSSFIGKNYVGLRLELMLQPIKIPLLSSIPLIGPVFFNQDILVYTAYILTVVLWFLLYKTKWGLYIRAVGENPYAADSMGINIYVVRYLCTVFGGMLAGLGGAYITVAYMHTWREGITMGKGWAAVALVIFAFWNPLRGFLASLFFGGIEVAAIELYSLYGLNTHLTNMIPYAAIIIVMILSASEIMKKRIGAPASLGKPFIREKRR